MLSIITRSTTLRRWKYDNGVMYSIFFFQLLTKLKGPKKLYKVLPKEEGKEIRRGIPVADSY